MSSFTEQVPVDPDDPELDYTPLRLSERAAKLGPSVSQGARSEPIRSSPISRPVSLDPKATYERARHTRDLDRRAALLSVAARVVAVAGVVAHTGSIHIFLPVSNGSARIGHTDRKCCCNFVVTAIGAAYSGKNEYRQEVRCPSTAG